jgi:site-specific DNA recombinase
MRGSLYGILRNPIYIGQVVHKGKTYLGLHEPIIDRQIWDGVQLRLNQNSVERSRQTRSRHPSLLAGLVFDGAGERLSPTHTNKGGTRYRYYVSHALVNGTLQSNSKRWRIPAQELETAITSELRSFLGDHRQLTAVVDLRRLTPAEVGRVLTAAKETGAALGRAQLQQLVTRIVVDETTIAISLDLAQLRHALGLLVSGPDDRPSHTFVADLRVTKRGVEQRLILGSDVSEGKRDQALIRAIARAYTWFEDIKQARVRDLSGLARREKLPRSYVQAHLPLAFLSPNIVKAILAGRQPAGLSLKQLMTRIDLAADWSKQRRQLGFSD